MNKEEFDKFSDDIIFYDLESVSDGFESSWVYNQVREAIRLAYNKGLEVGFERYGPTKLSELQIDKVK